MVGTVHRSDKAAEQGVDALFAFWEISALLAVRAMQLWDCSALWLPSPYSGLRQRWFAVPEAFAGDNHPALFA